MNCLKNVKYYALGQAELELTENSLRVKNLSNSGLDGIMIEVDGVEDFKDFQITTRNNRR